MCLGSRFYKTHRKAKFEGDIEKERDFRKYISVRKRNYKDVLKWLKTGDCIMWGGNIAYLAESREIFIRIKDEYKNREYTAADFSFLEIEMFDFWEISYSCFIRIKDRGPDDLLQALVALEQLEFVKRAEPNRILFVRDSLS